MTITEQPPPASKKTTLTGRDVLSNRLRELPGLPSVMNRNFDNRMLAAEPTEHADR